MPNPSASYSTTALTNTAESGNNTETVVATLSNVLPRLPGQVIRLRGWVDLLTGTGTTAGTLRIRRQTLTGTLVSPANANAQSIAASKVCDIDVECNDSPGEGNQVYVLTYQGTGDTGVATFNNCLLSANVT